MRIVILAADVGATKTRLALFEIPPPGVADPEPGGLRLVAEETYPSAQFPGLGPIVALFRRDHPRPVRAASAGVAGPVRDGRSITTNLPWVIDAATLAAEIGVPAFILLNDLEASAWGLPAVDPQDVMVLHPGKGAARGNIALISPGTGLGEAGLYWDGERHRPFATEGGHSGFAPSDDLQIELSRWLQARHGRASWERILSGPGLVALYEFLRETGRGAEPEWLAETMRDGDPAAAISEAALAGRSDLAGRALDLFVTLLGAEAGDLALKMMATGGVCIGGGIAPKILPRLQTGALVEAFLAKGRMRPVVEAMPLRVILDDRTVLLGAARRALLEAAGRTRG